MLGGIFHRRPPLTPPHLAPWSTATTFRLFEPRGCGLSSWVDASAKPGLSKGHTHGTSIAYFVLLPMPLISTTVNSSAREPLERRVTGLFRSQCIPRAVCTPRRRFGFGTASSSAKWFSADTLVTRFFRVSSPIWASTLRLRPRPKTASK